MFNDDDFKKDNKNQSHLREYTRSKNRNYYGDRPTYYDNEDSKIKKKKGRKTSIGTLIVVSLVSAIIGGLIAAYIAPNYIYGKLIEDPSYTGKNLPKIEIFTKEEDLSVVSAVAKKSMPSVVGITTVSVQQDIFFGPTKSQGVGTGVIVDSRGYILTNSHVVNNGETEEVKVLLYDGETLNADVLWNETTLDLAVVKVEAENLPVADLGNSDDLIVGELAIAIGNPLGLSFERTVTSGIISGLNRSIQINQYESIDSLIQTDASINPGNSGGPLLNNKGEVIGINTAKIQTGEGLGFAIPINIAKPIVDEFIEKGEFSKVYLGIRGLDVREFIRNYGEGLGTDTGVFVYQVSPNSAAARAGLRSGDVITGLGGSKIGNMRELVRELYKYRPGDETTLQILRNQEKMKLNVEFK